MIILRTFEDVNKFFETFDDEFIPKYLVFRVIEVDIMVETRSYRDAGLQLKSEGIDYIAGVYNEFPAALEKSKNLKHPIMVVKVQDRGLVDYEASLPN